VTSSKLRNSFLRTYAFFYNRHLTNCVLYEPPIPAAFVQSIAICATKMAYFRISVFMLLGLNNVIHVNRHDSDVKLLKSKYGYLCRPGPPSLCAQHTVARWMYCAINKQHSTVVMKNLASAKIVKTEFNANLDLLGFPHFITFKECRKVP